jgi:hypothetical protein
MSVSSLRRVDFISEGKYAGVTCAPRRERNGHGAEKSASHSGRMRYRKQNLAHQSSFHIDDKKESWRPLGI